MSDLHPTFESITDEWLAKNTDRTFTLLGQALDTSEPEDNEDDHAALGITEEDVTEQDAAPYDGRTIDEVLNILRRHIDRKKSYQLAETRALVNVRRDIQGLP